MDLHNQSSVRVSMSPTDPVCGMTVEPQEAAGWFEYRGETYFFCSLGCREKFKADPERFLNPQPANPIGIQRSPRPVQIDHGSEDEQSGRGRPRTEYTCPMHPEIVRNAPGSCPICGMALEPRTITLTEEKSPELIEMPRRFWVSAALSLPLLLIAMSEMRPRDSLGPIARLLPMRSIIWIQFVLVTPGVWRGGR